jgi:hypothetical protein
VKVPNAVGWWALCTLLCLVVWSCGGIPGDEYTVTFNNTGSHSGEDVTVLQEEISYPLFSPSRAWNPIAEIPAGAVNYAVKVGVSSSGVGGKSGLLRLGGDVSDEVVGEYSIDRDKTIDIP